MSQQDHQKCLINSERISSEALKEVMELSSFMRKSVFYLFGMAALSLYLRTLYRREV